MFSVKTDILDKLTVIGFIIIINISLRCKFSNKPILRAITKQNFKI